MSFGIYGDPDRHLLPHPAIGLPVLLIVENAICAAWELLRTHPRQGFDLLTADEDKLTHELYEALFDHIFKKETVAGTSSQQRPRSYWPSAPTAWLNWNRRRRQSIAAECG